MSTPDPITLDAFLGPEGVIARRLPGYEERSPDEMLAAADGFLASMRRRRTVRDFSDRPVPREILEKCLLAAGTAPNGANRQPWRFVAVGAPDAWTASP